MMGGQILSALRDAAAQNPEKALEIVEQVKAQWATLSDEQKTEVVFRLQEIQEKAASLSPEQRTQIADAIRGLG